MIDVGTFKTLSEEELKKAAASAEEALPNRGMVLTHPAR